MFFLIASRAPVGQSLEIQCVERIFAASASGNFVGAGLARFEDSLLAAYLAAPDHHWFSVIGHDESFRR
jgi:hypothetical protein